MPGDLKISSHCATFNSSNYNSFRRFYPLFCLRRRIHMYVNSRSPRRYTVSIIRMREETHILGSILELWRYKAHCQSSDALYTSRRVSNTSLDFLHFFIEIFLYLFTLKKYSSCYYLFYLFHGAVFSNRSQRRVNKIRLNCFQILFCKFSKATSNVVCPWI